MRAAVVHDWFQGFHGSERVAEEIRRLLVEFTGQAVDVYTFHAIRPSLPSELVGAITQESRLARLPGIRGSADAPGRWRYLLPLMPHYFEKLDLSDYDLVVSSAHACAAGVRAGPGAVHVCYCHTPIRYIWLPETERERVRGVAGLGLRLSRRWLVRRDLAASRRPGSYVANSSAVRDRIRYFYGRDATVIHPPVDTARLRPSRVRENGHFLWVNRLTAYKQPLVVAEAFRGLPFRLTMVGVGPLESALRKSRPPNVEVLGWLDDDRLVELFEGATGFVHVGEEDFGISMVEALAAGTPVVALSRGGAVDIVRHGTDGVLIAEPTVRAVRDAVMETARRTWDRPSLAERAALFSRERFAEQFGAHLAAILGSPTPIRRSADERRQRGGFRGRPE